MAFFEGGEGLESCSSLDFSEFCVTIVDMNSNSNKFNRRHMKDYCQSYKGFQLSVEINWRPFSSFLIIRCY